jgi:hypothetical protein
MHSIDRTAHFAIFPVLHFGRHYSSRFGDGVHQHACVALFSDNAREM